MLAVKLLNWWKGDFCFGLTLPHEAENPGIVGLEGPSQVRWPNLPCTGGRWEVQGVGEGSFPSSPLPSACVWLFQGISEQETLCVSKNVGRTSSGLYFLQEFSQGCLHLLTLASSSQPVCSDEINGIV